MFQYQSLLIILNFRFCCQRETGHKAHAARQRACCYMRDRTCYTSKGPYSFAPYDPMKCNLSTIPQPQQTLFAFVCKSFKRFAISKKMFRLGVIAHEAKRGWFSQLRPLVSSRIITQIRFFILYLQCLHHMCFNCDLSNTNRTTSYPGLTRLFLIIRFKKGLGVIRCPYA